MNKALYVLVYAFLALAAGGLYFELQLNAKRAYLTDRNRMQEDYIVKLARTIEKVEPTQGDKPAVKKDSSPVEAKLVDEVDTENVLEDYHAELEQANLETFSWDSPQTRDELRQVYVTKDGTPLGEPEMDGSEPLKRGSPEDKLLSQLIEAAKSQQTRLNSTRAELVSLHKIIENLVAEINKLKPEARQDKVTIVEKTEKIAKLEGEKTALENEVTKLKAQIEELNGEIASLKDEVTTAKDETAAKVEELEKSQKLVESLKKLLQEALVTSGARSARGNAAITSLPAGDKGKIVEADNENMFAIVQFNDETMKELKGPNGDQPLPALEIGVRRPGYKGEAGEFVGRLRLRQEVKGKPYIICDILGSWEQAKLAPGDVVFAD